MSSKGELIAEKGEQGACQYVVDFFFYCLFRSRWSNASLHDSSIVAQDGMVVTLICDKEAFWPC